MTVTFCGHRDYVYDNKKEDLKKIITNTIENGATEFLLGGYGAFDLICAYILKELRKSNDIFKTILVIPYLNNKYDLNLYDSSIYPPIEHIPLKYAIAERNKWMVNKSNIIISGVMHSYGGASKTLLYAQKLNKKIMYLK
ncbi:MAG: hypothetical protein IKK26_05465 [Clostridia bacterium]|nr:hypothetical protein [Clostridia bacterium]